MNQEDRSQLYRYLQQGFPKAVLLTSVSAWDKQEFVDEVARFLQLEAVDITANISYDYLMGLYVETGSYLYVINLDQIALSKQNALLKFVEECPTRTYVILLAQPGTTVLPTLQTRCIDFRLHTYTQAEIKQYADSRNLDQPLMAAIAWSFDEVESFSQFNLENLYKLCINIGTNLSRATLPNTLSIAQKYLYFKEKEPEKYSVEVFARMLQYYLLTSFQNQPAKITYSLYGVVADFIKRLTNSAVSKEMLVNNLLLELWVASRGEV